MSKITSKNKDFFWSSLKYDKNSDITILPKSLKRISAPIFQIYMNCKVNETIHLHEYRELQKT